MGQDKKNMEYVYSTAFGLIAESDEPVSKNEIFNAIGDHSRFDSLDQVEEYLDQLVELGRFAEEGGGYVMGPNADK